MAHRLLCHPTLGLIVVKKKKKVHRAAAKGHGRRDSVLEERRRDGHDRVPNDVAHTILHLFASAFVSIELDTLSGLLDTLAGVLFWKAAAVMDVMTLLTSYCTCSCTTH